MLHEAVTGDISLIFHSAPPPTQWPLAGGLLHALRTIADHGTSGDANELVAAIAAEVCVRELWPQCIAECCVLQRYVCTVQCTAEVCVRELWPQCIADYGIEAAAVLPITAIAC